MPRRSSVWSHYQPLKCRGTLLSSTDAQSRKFCAGTDWTGNDLKEIALSLVASLKACAKTKDLCHGIRLHTHIRTTGLLEKSIHLGNSLISMYAKCGALTKAQQVLEELPIRDVVSWNALIAGYVQQGQAHESFTCYECMRRSDGLVPDAITYSCILKACGITKEVEKGIQIHDEILYRRLLGKNVVLGTALVDMYAKCGKLRKARHVLDDLPIRDAICWNALIAGHISQGQGAEALDCYDHMQRDGVFADAVTYACVLKACGITRVVHRGKQIHDEVVSQGLLSKSLVLGNALVDMYAKCGLLTEAREALIELPVRDVVSWSALIAGFTQQGQAKEALACFQQMRREGISPNAITYTCILKAYGITEEVEGGKRIHDEIVSKGLLQKHVELGSALIDMYSKCGILTIARQVLDKLPVRDLVSWSALIVGYAQRGQAEQALDCFQRMRREGFAPDLVSWNALIVGFAQQGKAENAFRCFQWMQGEGVSPNAVTFTCMLNACSHSGLVNEGQTYFEDMMKKYGIVPNIEHHTCMIDLFGRAGHFDKAMGIFKKLPSYDHPPIWSSLMDACRNWGNVKLGRLVFDKAVQLDQHDAAAYACMAEIYADAGMQEDAKKIEAMKLKMLLASSSEIHGG
ncbi:hypothetical protein GOP47_0004458 [Adiantum capillus-veneris]|uniref:Pentatricopeptide repeat-containing protein n=1 Tax=Adiantum capillus-veneris TaxID=13818 RepID=A0A9D4V8A2_ADICA|nr:hypothetical protein GOP47_0004458 [Adiantum capillus-veneris]